MWGGRPPSRRFALAVLATFWTVGACLLVASCRSAVAENRAREAPTCSESQLFTAAECRATLDATMISLNSHRAEMYVKGRRVSAGVKIAGPIPYVRDLPVRVTLYRGEPIHVEGQDLTIDTDDSPANSRADFLFWGTALLIIGPFVVGANTLIRFLGRRWATPR
jgi:hypothetical protein